MVETKDHYIKDCWIQGLLNPSLWNPKIVEFKIVEPKDCWIQDCWIQGLLNPRVVESKGRWTQVLLKGSVAKFCWIQGLLNAMVIDKECRKYEVVESKVECWRLKGDAENTILNT